MGANAQTTVPTFVAAQVLTADQQNQSARTGVPVFATTVTRDAAFGGSGEKTLAEGQLCYLEDTNVVQYYDGAAWATVGPATSGALTLISATTIGTGVASVSITNVFSSTYDNYKITMSGGTATDANLILQLGATTTGYYATYVRYTYGNVASTAADNNGANFSRVGYANTNGTFMSLDVFAPNLATNTFIAGGFAQNNTGAGAGAINGFLANTTSYTGFTIAATSLTGGTIRVYGYSNS